MIGYQAWLAGQVGYSPQMTSLILWGKRTPSWGQAKKLAAITGIPVEVWMEAKQNPQRLQEEMKNAARKKVGVNDPSN